jgi:paraquat-inducible protein A
MTDHRATPLHDLIACPQCDSLYRVRIPAHGERARCERCGTVMIAPRKHAGMIIIMLALTVLILVFGSLWFPFLQISAGGLTNSATILDAALSFTGGPLLIVSLAVTALILVVPLIRAVLTLYVLVPIVFDNPPRPAARPAFRMAEALRPWSMAEIFAIGCAVSLVKVADLADLSFGPAFWMFAALVVVNVVQDTFMCRWSVWNAIDDAEAPR